MGGEAADLHGEVDQALEEEDDGAHLVVPGHGARAGQYPLQVGRQLGRAAHKRNRAGRGQAVAWWHRPAAQPPLGAPPLTLTPRLLL